MNIETRKINLIHWITRLTDEEVLKQIENLKNKDADWWDELPESVRNSVEKGIEQADNGEMIPHENVIKEVKAKYGL
ncbi:MAG: hypothetical protein AB7E36_01700 [Salinivirgaceae bacterium]